MMKENTTQHLDSSIPNKVVVVATPLVVVLVRKTAHMGMDYLINAAFKKIIGSKSLCDRAETIKF